MVLYFICNVEHDWPRFYSKSPECKLELVETTSEHPIDLTGRRSFARGAPERVVVGGGGSEKLPEEEGPGQRRTWLDCGFDAARHDQSESVCLAHHEHPKIPLPLTSGIAQKHHRFRMQAAT